MPTTIDRENAKQIRQPMDVLITMQVPDDDITLSFSGYTSTSKVSDGRLTQPTWPMRRLADLQGDGFALSGSCALYESLTPSATNGKLGVRGHVGQTVNLTVTGSQQMAGLMLLVTGASAVTYNGVAHEVISGRVSFLVGATTASLTLTPASEETRIEISEVQTGADITINNDNLISCTLSLRSDLKPVDPTLPESEMNIEAYFGEDVSEAVAMIPDDTPVYYRAGYDSDMSQTRSFYVSGQVTWKDSVLSIHAVDAVHFLDIEMPELTPGNYIFSYATNIAVSLVGWLYNLGLIRLPNIPRFFYWFDDSGNGNAITTPTAGEVATLREYIATCMNMFRFRDIDARYLETTRYGMDYVIDYVDAGIPNARVWPDYYRQPTVPEWTISEDDCGDCSRNVDRAVSALKFKTVNTKAVYNSAMNSGNVPVGTARWVKGVGISLDFDAPCLDFAIAIESTILPNAYGWDWSAIAPVTTTGWFETNSGRFNEQSAFKNYNTVPIIVNGLPNGTIWADINWADPSGVIHNLSGDVRTSFIPWNATYFNVDVYPYKSMQAVWNALVRQGVIASDAKEWSCDIRGVQIISEDALTLVGTGSENGATEITPKLRGQVITPRDRDKSSTTWEMYPTSSMENLLKRSPITGSFTWKGDPRMQPRDIIHFHRLDGTVEDVTIETITLKHEGGGTSAEITYRKGVI